MNVRAPQLVRPAYRDFNVLRWLTGFGLSLLGDQVYFIALAWAAAQVASPSQVGLILAAGSIPRAVLMPFGGAIADRVGPKRLVLVSDSARTVIMVVLAVALIGGRPSIPVLAALAVVFGLVDALFLPAVGAMPARLTGSAEQARVQGMRGLVQRGSLVVGAPMAGWMAAQYGLAVAFGFNAVLFALSVLALLWTRLLPVPPSESADAAALRPGGAVGGLLADVRAGIRYVRGHRLLTPLLLLTGVVDFGFVGPLNTGLPLLSAARGWGAPGIGLTLGAFGAGAALSAFAVVVAGRIPRAGVVSCAAVIFMGVALGAVGSAESLTWAVAASFALGLGGGLVGALLNALILNVTDTGQIGRVMAFAGLVSYGGIPISYALTGFIAGIFNAGTSFLVGGGIAVLISSVALFRQAVRNAELAPTSRADQSEEAAPPSAVPASFGSAGEARDD